MFLCLVDFFGTFVWVDHFSIQDCKQKNKNIQESSFSVLIRHFLLKLIRFEAEMIRLCGHNVKVLDLILRLGSTNREKKQRINNIFSNCFSPYFCSLLAVNILFLYLNIGFLVNKLIFSQLEQKRLR